MSKQLSQVIADRLNMQPVMISPAHVNMITDSLRQMQSANHDVEESESQRARVNLLAAYGYEYEAQSEEKPFVFADGIAFIPVTGLLINRFSYQWGWVTGYNFIRAQLTAALDDSDVKLILFDCHSGGGEVSGCFELCADIFTSRAVKPSVAVVDSASYSACYAIASSASKIVVTPSGGVGSIGVVAMHLDYSKYLSEVGIKVSFIFSGDHKVDGNMYEELPEPVRKSIQSRVDATRKEFVSLVATNRGLDTQVVFDTQAKCYSASEALDMGLIDAIKPPLEAVQASLIELTGSVTIQENNVMTTAEKKPGAESAKAPNTETATATVTAVVNAEATGVEKSAAQVERDRIKAITTHEKAANKSALANHLALNTDLSVDAAASILENAAAENVAQTTTGANAFKEAMDTSTHPNVGADSSEGEGMTAAQRIIRSQEIATGVKH